MKWNCLDGQKVEESGREQESDDAPKAKPAAGDCHDIDVDPCRYSLSSIDIGVRPIDI